MRIKMRPLLRATIALPLAALVAMALTSPLQQARAAEPPVSFAQDVLPLLKWKCAGCHAPGGEGYEKSGVDLTSYQGVMKGTKYGPMIVPGDPQASNLIRLLDWQVPKAIRMPHGQKQLCACLRNDIREWIRQGAKDN